MAGQAEVVNRETAEGLGNSVKNESARAMSLIIHRQDTAAALVKVKGASGC